MGNPHRVSSPNQYKHPKRSPDRKQKNKASHSFPHRIGCCLPFSRVFGHSRYKNSHIPQNHHIVPGIIVCPPGTGRFPMEYPVPVSFYAFFYSIPKPYRCLPYPVLVLHHLVQYRGIQTVIQPEVVLFQQHRLLALCHPQPLIKFLISVIWGNTLKIIQLRPAVKKFHVRSPASGKSNSVRCP